MSFEFDPKALVRLREDFRMSRGQLSEASGITLAAIGRMEDGTIRKPHPSTIRKLASALEVEPIALMRQQSLTFSPLAITKLRMSQALSPGELGDIAGLSPATILNIESGRVKNPNPETLRKLASALNVTSLQLVEETSPLIDGSKVQAIRYARAIRLQDLMVDAQLKPEIVIQLEDGDWVEMTPEDARRLAKALKVDVSEIGPAGP